MQSKTVRAHTDGEGLGKRDARSGQTGVTGRYPLVACGKGRTRYCYCAFLHPSRSVHSAPLRAASDSQISPWALLEIVLILGERIKFNKWSVRLLRSVKGTNSFDFFLKTIFNKVFIQIARGRMYLLTDLFVFFSSLYLLFIIHLSFSSVSGNELDGVEILSITLFTIDSPRPTCSNIVTRLADLAFHLASHSAAMFRSAGTRSSENKWPRGD